LGLPAHLQGWDFFDSVGVGIVLVSSEDLVVQGLNREMESLGMYPEAEIIGKNFVDVFFKSQEERAFNLFQLKPIRPEMIITENSLKLCRKSGRKLHVNISVKTIPESDMRLLTITNSEPRRELELELERVYEQMIQSSKFVSLAEMAAGIAHEINNPLAIIHSKVEQLLFLSNSDRLEKNKAQELCEKVLTSTMRASKIIGTLKSLSRADQYEELTINDLRTIVSQATDLCREQFRSQSSEVELELPLLPVLIQCSTSQLLQVCLNLLENSLHAMRESEVRVATLSLKTVGDYAVLKIEDTGSGVPKGVQNEIMNPFFTTKGVGQGIGLGLSISRSIVNRHQGKITCVPSDCGACFELEFPLAKQEPTRACNVFSLIRGVSTSLRISVQSTSDQNLAGAQHKIAHLSQGGIFIEEPGLLPRVGTEVNLTIDYISPRGDQSFSSRAKVKWISPRATPEQKKGYGLEFQELDNKGEAFLESLFSQFSEEKE
jgi:PAS domain S-box-containing protein